MNTYYFSVDNRDIGEVTLFKVSAMGESDALDEFVKKFVPYINNLSYSDMISLFEQYDIFISYAGEKIIDL